jgi:hypothetical protein
MFPGFFHKPPTLNRYWKTIIAFKLQKKVFAESFYASQDGACTDLFENLSVNNLKGDLSNATIFNFQPTSFLTFKVEVVEDLTPRFSHFQLGCTKLCPAGNSNSCPPD